MTKNYQIYRCSHAATYEPSITNKLVNKDQGFYVVGFFLGGGGVVKLLSIDSETPLFGGDHRYELISNS